MKLTIPLSELVLYGVLPFNLIKGVIVGTVFVLVYAKIHVWLDNKANEFLAETKSIYKMNIESLGSCLTTFLVGNRP